MSMFQDTILTDKERSNLIDMLHGCICRICVSDDELEIVRYIGFANMYISKLAQSNIRSIRKEKKEKGDKNE